MNKFCKNWGQNGITGGWRAPGQNDSIFMHSRQGDLFTAYTARFAAPVLDPTRFKGFIPGLITIIKDI